MFAPDFGWIGVCIRSESSGPNVEFVRTMRFKVPSYRLPDGATMLPLETAVIACSGDTPYCFNLSGSRLTTIVRWLPPNGGGAETPGRRGKRGRTWFHAIVCSARGVGFARVNSKSPTATLPGPNRVMNGGTVPRGI